MVGQRCTLKPFPIIVLHPHPIPNRSCHGSDFDYDYPTIFITNERRVFCYTEPRIFSLSSYGEGHS